jgi:hypothetical protein
MAQLADVMPGGSWWDRRDCASCEGRRRLVKELMEAWDDDGNVRKHAAD